MIFLSSLNEHHKKPIFKYNTESTKPPLIFGVYRVDNQIIFTPYFYNKNMEFSIDSLKGKIQIVAYLAKSVPDQFKSRSILDLEVFAILTALHSLQRYISNTKCHLLTDSRVLSRRSYNTQSTSTLGTGLSSNCPFRYNHSKGRRSFNAENNQEMTYL